MHALPRMPAGIVYAALGYSRMRPQASKTLGSCELFPACPHGVLLLVADATRIRGLKLLAYEALSYSHRRP
jgi:hypothetical protein